MFKIRLFRRFWEQIKTGEIQIIAAALSFTTMLSLIPFIAVILATIQWIGGPDFLYPKAEAFILSYLKGPAGTDGIEMLKKIFSRIYSGKIGAIGALGLVITSLMMIRDIDRGIQRIWSLSARSIFKRFFSYWLVFLALPIILGVFVGLMSFNAIKNVSNAIPFFGLQGVVAFFLLFLLNKIVPAIKVKNAPAAVGSLFSTIGLFVLLGSFKLITTKVFNYSKVYGSIAALPALLLWILLIWYVILLGCALTASMNQKDT